MQRFQQGQQQHKEWQSPSPTHHPQCRALCCSLVLVLGFSKRRHRWNPCWWWLELHEEHAQHKPNKAGLLDRIPSSTGTGTITHQIEFALKFHIEIDDCFKSTSPCLWILSVWYSLRQSQGLGPRRKNPSIAFVELWVWSAFLYSLQCQCRSAETGFPPRTRRMQD